MVRRAAKVIAVPVVPGWLLPVRLTGFRTFSVYPAGDLPLLLQGKGDITEM